MEFKWKELKEAGFKIEEQENGPDLMVKTDGKPFNMWVGSHRVAHVSIDYIKKLEIDSPIEGAFWYETIEESSGCIFDTQIVGVWADEHLNLI